MDINVWTNHLFWKQPYFAWKFPLWYGVCELAHLSDASLWSWTTQWIQSEAKILKTLRLCKLCEMASGRGRCERFPARRDSYAMSITCAKLRRKLSGKKYLEIPSSQGNLQRLHCLRNWIALEVEICRKASFSFSLHRWACSYKKNHFYKKVICPKENWTQGNTCLC